jgi:AcrR family transcriptional regulator
MIRVMKAADDAPGRLYDNSHRAAQAARTREQILDALVRVMARGVAELSMPAVARDAGVSLRTVYRHFPTKRDLLAALDAHLAARIGLSLAPLPGTLSELSDHIRRYFRALGSMDDAERAIWASSIAGEARDATLQEKLRMVNSALDSIPRTLSEADRTRLFNVTTTLFSRYALQRMQDDLGITADEAADSVVWAIQTLVCGATGAEVGDAVTDDRTGV